MKKIIIIFSLIFSGIAFGQFTIADSSDSWEKIGNVYAHTILYERTDKTKAKIEYRDFQNVNPYSMDLSYYIFEFSTEPDTLEKIYQIFKDHFATKKEETVTLQFPEGKMILEFGKSFGAYYGNFKFEKASELIDKGEKSMKTSGAFTERQLSKLFGKK
ncbi:hypothetical protein [Kaistella palustris]|uniref:hypothetical protein n=1 Tax=Kaistella palustris TaxID=493376 RepID=UPI0012ECA772|nr:hypothetical protein [Kaistella palustris]